MKTESLRFAAVHSLLTAKNSADAMGALCILKILGDQKAILLWNYLTVEIHEGRLPHYEQLQWKYKIVEDETPFWAISSDGDLIKSNQTSPRSFYAPDRESAILYAQEILGAHGIK